METFSVQVTMLNFYSTGLNKKSKVLEWENRLLLTTDESRLESSRFQKLERIKKTTSNSQDLG